VVEFGAEVTARAVTAGGLDSRPGAKHFNDQADRYARGELRPVHFSARQLAEHTERVYRPGDELRSR
jgi:acyl-homoserine-lactone acylase